LSICAYDRSEYNHTWVHLTKTPASLWLSCVTFFQVVASINKELHNG